MRRGLVAVVLVGLVAPARAQDPAPEPPAETEPAEPAVPPEPTPVRAPEPAPEPEPPPPREKTPFDRGKFSLGISGGSQTTLGNRYFGIGGAVGYFVLDGVELGLGALYQFGDGPSIFRLTPALRYIAQPLVPKSPLIPYVGVFYNHWFIGNSIVDVDTVGTRGGLVYVSGKVILGLGVVYERIVSECVMDCSSVYPDFTISLSL